jgi:DNA repair protein RecO
MSKKHDVQTRGIIINRFSSGEGSARVLLLTESCGLVSALVKSGREERSKLRAHSTVGTFGTFDLVRGREIWRFVGAVKTHHAYFDFQENVALQKAVARIFSVLRQLITGEEKDERLFGVVWDFLNALPHIRGDVVLYAERFTVLKILAILGYVSHHASYIEKYTYAYDDLLALIPHEREMHRTIHDGFVASGLL